MEIKNLAQRIFFDLKKDEKTTNKVVRDLISLGKNHLPFYLNTTTTTHLSIKFLKNKISATICVDREKRS